MQIFFDYSEHSLDSFQLENLLNNGVPFKLFLIEDISDCKSKLLEKVLHRGVTSKNPTVDLEKEKIDKEHPIVLLCKNGKSSKKWIKKIVNLEFKNVYFISDGAHSLQSSF